MLGHAEAYQHIPILFLLEKPSGLAEGIAKFLGSEQYDHLEPDGKQFIQMAMKFAQRPNFPPFGGSGARYKISVGTEPSAAEQMISLDSVEHNPEGKNI